VDQVIFYIGRAYVESVGTNLHVDREKALRGLDTALKYNPNLSSAYVLKGRLYYDAGLTSYAIQSFSQAMSVQQSLADIYLFRAKAYLQDNDLDLARGDLLTELRIYDRYEVRRLLGEVSLRGLDYDQALEHFNRAIEMEPELIPARIGRARVYRLQALQPGLTTRFREDLRVRAYQDIGKVLLKNSDYAEAILEKGSLLKDQERFVEALSLFGMIIQRFDDLDPESLTHEHRVLLADAYLQRGEIQLKNGNRNLAQADMERALKVRPNYAEAYNRLGEVARKSNDFQNARDNYLRAIEIDPNNPDFDLSLAILYQENKSFQKAIDHYQSHQRKRGTELRVDDWIRECQDALASK